MKPSCSSFLPRLRDDILEIKKDGMKKYASAKKNLHFDTKSTLANELAHAGSIEQV